MVIWNRRYALDILSCYDVIDGKCGRYSKRERYHHNTILFAKTNASVRSMDVSINQALVGELFPALDEQRNHYIMPGATRVDRKPHCVRIVRPRWWLLLVMQGLEYTLSGPYIRTHARSRCSHTRTHVKQRDGG